MTDNLITDLGELQRRIYEIPCNCGGCGWVTIDVPYGHPAFSKPFRCSCQKDLMKVKLHKAAGLPPRRAACSFEWFNKQTPQKRADKEHCYEVGKEWIASNTLPGGKVWLMLEGNPSMGKSSLAACIAGAWIEAGRQVLWLDLNEFLTDVYSAQQQSFMPPNERDPGLPHNLFAFVDSVARVPYLVLDDFGDMRRSEEVSNFQRDKIYDVLRYRYEYNMPTIITSNLNYAKLAEIYGERIADRFIESAYWMLMEGASLRW